MLIPILISIIAASALVIVIMLIRSSTRAASVKNKAEKRVKDKGRNVIVKECEKKLAHNPHNIPALETLGELYYKENNWEKSWTIYRTLFDMSASHGETDQVKNGLRLGISSYRLDKIDEALNPLMETIKKDPQNFDALYFLGLCFLKKEILDKAVACLKKAHLVNQESTQIYQPLGNALFKAKKYRDALPYLKKAIELQPDNKETMFNMAIGMSECGMGDKALKVFLHLRPDAVYGPQSCLEAGKMHQRAKAFDSAIQDYEIAMKLPNVAENILIQIKYNCATSYFAQNNIPKGLALLREVQSIKPDYKDVDQLIVRYNELNQNSNLQTYLLSGTSDFVALCRKFISIYYPGAFVKIIDVQVASESIELLVEIEGNKMEEKEVFRFYRTSTVMGDIYVRDFHSKIRDLKCDKGVCVTMGTFSESAHKFIEGRPIDLIEKEALVKILKKINMM
ncbi:MAG: tetratricopeptide repeat protein [Treponema sp.]|nr:tetratricopeptide repeat protein [Treponema sp.]